MKTRTFSALISMIMLLICVASTMSIGTVDAQDSPGPGLRAAHGMVYDPQNEVMVIFGGFDLTGGYRVLGDTWFYDYQTNAWTKYTASPSPPARSNLAMVYCSGTNEIIMYGGGEATDTWSFNCNSQTWSQVGTDINPGVHYSHAMSYDPTENAVFLFGGFTTGGIEQNDTWRFDCTTREWSELFPDTSPIPRYGHVMVFDESINRTVLTAGNTATQGHQDDTWYYNGTANAWIQIDTTGNPYKLKWPSMTYDVRDQKCIVFGGQVGDYAVDATWVYDAQSTTWTHKYPDSSPPKRINSGLAFDAGNGVVIMYGGVELDVGMFGDVWAYNYSTNVWTELSVGTSNTAAIDGNPIPIIPLLAVASIAAVVLVFVAYSVRRRA